MRDRATKEFVPRTAQEPGKPSSPAEAAEAADAKDSFATAKHYICTALGVVLAVHFYSAYVQTRHLLVKTAWYLVRRTSKTG